MGSSETRSYAPSRTTVRAYDGATAVSTLIALQRHGPKSPSEATQKPVMCVAIVAGRKCSAPGGMNGKLHDIIFCLRAVQREKPNNREAAEKIELLSCQPDRFP
jgi:hypothetical protein